MAKTRRITPGGRVVTEARLALLLSDFARAADASLTVKMETMREELRAELKWPHGDPLAGMSDEQRARLIARFTLQDAPEGSAPTDSEGAE